MITPCPNFIESEFFISDKNGWRLLPGASWDVRREFNAFMRQTKRPFISEKIDFRDYGVARRSGKRWALDH